MHSYNLVDEAWIPCAEREGGAPRLLSLRAVFAEAPRLAAIADSSPATAISLHRVLLAILHRSLNGPSSVGDWKAAWEGGHWDLDRINRYLDTWHGRFDLFDTQYPFYQTPGIAPNSEPPDSQAPKSATLLAHERASERNRALLFDHTHGDASLPIDAAARYLIAMHNFAFSGLYSYVPGSPSADRHASQAPLLGAAVVLARGETLFQTLMLNWVRYHRTDDVPFPFRAGADDQPAWEREGGAKPEKRWPDGYVDLLTWQSRRILLVPETTPPAGGMTRVRDAVLMKGYQFTDGFEQDVAETMLAFRKSTNPKLGPAWFAVKVDSDRVVWRDSQTFVQSVSDERKRPKTMDWLDTLVTRRALPEQWLVPIEVYGMIPDQANIRDWRRESLPVRLRLLTQDEAVTQHLLQHLKEAVDFAEEVGRIFQATLISLGSKRRAKSPMWVLCEALLAGGSEREPKREDCDALARSFGTGPRYWARLDTPFRGFIEGVADPGDVAVEDGATVYGTRALRQWVDAVRHAAEAVIQEVVDSLDTSAKALRAAALAQQEFRYQLAALRRALHLEAAERQKVGVSV